MLLSVSFDDGTFPVQFARVLLVGAAVFELVVKRLSANLVLWWQLLFVIYVASSISWAYDATTAHEVTRTVLINAICVIALVYLVVDDPPRVRLFFISLMLAPALLMGRVALTHGPLAFLDERAAGATSANIVGMVAAVGACIAYLAVSQGVLVGRAFASSMLAVNLLIVLLSASRKALMFVALAIILFAWFNRRSGGVPRIVKVGAALGLGLVGYWLLMNIESLYELAGNRIETMIHGFLGTGVVDASTTTRLGLIEKGLGWFQERPLTGHGAGGFTPLMAASYPGLVAEYAHNNFVELLVNGGLIGFLLFYWIYAVVIITGLKRSSRLDGLQAMMLSLVLTLLVMEYGLVDYYNRIFTALVAVAWIVVCTPLGRSGKLLPSVLERRSRVTNSYS